MSTLVGISMAIHLRTGYKERMRRANGKRIGTIRAKRGRTSMVQVIDIRTLHKMGRDDCQRMFTSRSRSEASEYVSKKTEFKMGKAFYVYQNVYIFCLKINKTHRHDQSCSTPPPRWVRRACSKDGLVPDIEHQEVYATIKSTSLH